MTGLAGFPLLSLTRNAGSRYGSEWWATATSETLGYDLSALAINDELTVRYPPCADLDVFLVWTIIAVLDITREVAPTTILTALLISVAERNELVLTGIKTSCVVQPVESCVASEFHGIRLTDGTCCDQQGSERCRVS